MGKSDFSFPFLQITQKILWLFFSARFRDQFNHASRNSFKFNMITSSFSRTLFGQKNVFLLFLIALNNLFNFYHSRDSLGWAVLLNFLVYITIPVVLQYTGILLGIGSIAIYVKTIIGLAKKENYFVEQVN